MKKLLPLPLALIFASNAAMAANSVDLRVTGTITPAACNITMTGGDFDLGTISSNDLAAMTTTTLPKVAGKTLNINCSGATQVAFKAIDNQESSIPPNVTGAQRASSFGLGTDSQGASIGRYMLKVNQPSILVDTAAGNIYISDNDGINWVESSMTDTALENSTLTPRIFALSTDTFGGLAPITDASAGLSVTAYIQPANTLDTSSNITMNGSATIELIYL